MPHLHRSFVVDMLGRIGTPIFCATLVGCLLQNTLEVIHGIMLAVGLGLMYVSHRLEYHGA